MVKRKRYGSLDEYFEEQKEKISGNIIYAMRYNAVNDYIDLMCCSFFNRNDDKIIWYYTDFLLDKYSDVKKSGSDAVLYLSLYSTTVKIVSDYWNKQQAQ